MNIGGYITVERLGSGSRSEVFAARREGGELIALKRPIDRSPRSAAALRRELVFAGMIRHPNVCRVLDSDLGEPFLALELMDGGSLSQALERAPLPVSVVVEIFLGIADALLAVERAGVVHRDVAPQNILLTRSGHAKLADFSHGEALAEGANARDPRFHGRLEYSAPRLFRGEDYEFGPGTDLYSFCASLFHAATGTPPFARAPGEEPEDARKRLGNHRPPRISSLRPGFPTRLDEAVWHVLGENPDAIESPRRWLHRLKRALRDELKARAGEPSLADWLAMAPAGGAAADGATRTATEALSAPGRQLARRRGAPAAAAAALVALVLAADRPAPVAAPVTATVPVIATATAAATVPVTAPVTATASVPATAPAVDRLVVSASHPAPKFHVIPHARQLAAATACPDPSRLHFQPGISFGHAKAHVTYNMHGCVVDLKVDP
jgi:serine/threonine-protein kinase